MSADTTRYSANQSQTILRAKTGSSTPLVLIALISAFMLLLSSCGSASPAPTDLGSTSGSKANSESPRTGAVAPQSVPPGSKGVAGQKSDAAIAPSTSSNTVPAEAVAAPWDRMVIRTTNLSIVVKDVEQAMAAIRTQAQSVEGFVSASNTQLKGEYMTGTVTLQIPARAFDETIQRIRSIGVKVQSENTASQDVTEEFVDTTAQVKNLQLTEASLQKLMDKATKVDEILVLQRELTNVRGQIERFQGRVNYLQRRSDMSTLTIILTPEPLWLKSQESVESTGFQPAKIIQNAWKASLETVTAIAAVVLAVVIYSWWLIPFIVLGIWLIRRSQRASEARRRERATSGAAPLQSNAQANADAGNNPPAPAGPAA